jgi:predicted nuclease of restriction endonuclease-like (RecB) superfamily
LKKQTSIQLLKNIKSLVQQSRKDLYAVANITLVETYYHIGRMIVEHEQQGKSRAGYAKHVLKNLSAKLSVDLGKGFSVDNLENMRKFYLTYEDSYNKHINKNEKSEAVSRKSNKTQKSEAVPRKLGLSPFKLSWTNYVLLLRIENDNERKFYEIESANENWTSRELQRQYDSALYERLILSRNKTKVKELSKKGHIISNASDVIKDPYILEFLNLPEKDIYSENDLEKAIIHRLQDFLSELGKGFLFVERQKKIRLDGIDYKTDLVFYHRILRCFVLIDLKIGTLQHKDIGQMQMYVNYYDEELKDKDENKTIGIILCRNKKESTIKYTLGKDNKQIFASKYKMYFPEKQILKLITENPKKAQ